jgi:hypothetical protein
MRSIAKIITNSLLGLSLLAARAESLNMVVQVTVAPKVTSKLPLCSLPLLELLQPLLTLWVTEATLSVIPDFSFIGGLVLSYRNTSSRRMLRADFQENDSRQMATTKTAAKASPGSCSTCTSAGCSSYCGNASCNYCSSSRRLSEETKSSENGEITDNDDRQQQERRELGAIDFNLLGVQVSATVQKLTQSLLLSSVLDLLGCLGDPLLLTTNVTFLLNQTFYP